MFQPREGLPGEPQEGLMLHPLVTLTSCVTLFLGSLLTQGKERQSKAPGGCCVLTWGSGSHTHVRVNVCVCVRKCM